MIGRMLRGQVHRGLETEATSIRQPIVIMNSRSERSCSQSEAKKNSGTHQKSEIEVAIVQARDLEYSVSSETDLREDAKISMERTLSPRGRKRSGISKPQRKTENEISSKSEGESRALSDKKGRALCAKIKAAKKYQAARHAIMLTSGSESNDERECSAWDIPKGIRRKVNTERGSSSSKTVI